MKHPSRTAALCLAATLAVAIMLAEGVAARGGGRGGGGGGRGGGGGYSRGGPAARGSFGRQPARGGYRGNYNRRGPAANGNFERGERQDMRQERREERQDGRDGVWDGDGQDPDRGENWQEYAEERYDDDDDYYADAYDGGVVYWSLPCKPNVIAMGGVVYYVCGSEWYTRAYDQGDVVYTPVPNPTGH